MNMAAPQNWLWINLLLAILCLTGCVTSLRPEIPRGSNLTPPPRFQLGNIHSTHSADTRQFLLAHYPLILNGHPTDPKLDVTITGGRRDMPGGGELFMNSLLLGLIPRTYRIGQKCSLRVTDQSNHILHELTAEGEASRGVWGYFAMFGEFYSRESWIVEPTEKRAEILATQAAMERLLDVPIAPTRVTESPPQENAAKPQRSSGGSALNIAVADIDPLGMSKEEVLTLTENLRSALVQSGSFQVVSRADMQKILKEQEFQRSDACNDTQCLVEMGKALAVQKIVGGSAGQAGGVYSLTLRVVDVETGKIEATVFKDIEKVRDLLSSVRDLGRQLADMYGR
jgi:TolB-like protein